MSGGHSYISASAMGRTLACPGWLSLPQRDDSTDYSRDGDKLHKVVGDVLANRQFNGVKFELEGGELTLSNGKDPPELHLTAKEVKAIDLCLDYVKAIRDHYQTVSEMVEVRIEHDTLPWIGGTPDVVLIYSEGGRSVFHVVDWKFGEGVLVEAKDNAQILTYLLLVYRWMLKQSGDVTKSNIIFRGTIFQPRISSTPSTCDYTEADLVAFEARIEARMFDNVLQTGDHCQFCPCVANCPARDEDFDEVAKAATLEHPWTLKVENDETYQRWVKVYSLKWSVLSYIKKVEAALKAELIDERRDVPGLKVVQGRKGNREWRGDQNKILDKLCDEGAEEDLLLELISPSKVEKATGLDLSTDGKLGHLVTQSEGGPSIALESSNRPDYVFPTDLEFERYEENGSD